MKGKYEAYLVFCSRYGDDIGLDELSKPNKGK
jgi:hypothetical protein